MMFPTEHKMMFRLVIFLYSTFRILPECLLINSASSRCQIWHSRCSSASTSRFDKNKLYYKNCVSEDSKVSVYSGNDPSSYQHQKPKHWRGERDQETQRAKPAIAKNKNHRNSFAKPFSTTQQQSRWSFLWTSFQCVHWASLPIPIDWCGLW